MKREILFKAKRVDNGEWVYGNLCVLTEDIRGFNCVNAGTYISNLVGMPWEYKVHPETVCQFIDEYNGNRFWESDTVEHPELGKGFIKYANTGYVIQYDNNYCIDLHEDWGVTEITGNIHDK